MRLQSIPLAGFCLIINICAEEVKRETQTTCEAGEGLVCESVRGVSALHLRSLKGRAGNLHEEPDDDDNSETSYAKPDAEKKLTRNKQANATLGKMREMPLLLKIPQIADHYTISYSVNSFEAVQNETFMDELEKREIFDKTGLDLDVLISTLGSPTITVTDGVGNVMNESVTKDALEKGDGQISLPISFDLVFNKKTSDGLELVQKNQMDWMKSACTRRQYADYAYSATRATADLPAGSRYIQSKDKQDNVFIYKCNFAFEGSEPDDPMDWINNIIGTFHYQPLKRWGSRWDVHSGFYKEFKAVQEEGLDDEVKKCDYPHFIGHSLGGAMATIARLWYGKGEVTTFNAPRVFWGDRGGKGCKFPEAWKHNRFFHDDDPVSNEPWTGFNWKHGQKGIKLKCECVERWYGFGFCQRWEDHAYETDCEDGSHGSMITTHFLYLWKSFFGCQ